MANASAVIYGTAQLYSTPFGTANNFPVATINYGTAWGTPTPQALPWETRGYTQDGISLNMTVDRDTIIADQVLDPLFRPITGRDVMISTNLLEMTAANLNLGLGQGTVTTVAPVGPTTPARGYDQWSLTANVTDQYNSWGLDAEQPENGEPFRAIVWKGLSSGGLETSFGNRASAGLIPVEITAIPDDSVQPTRIFTLRDYVPAL